MARIVDARITKVPNDSRPEFHHFRSLCGRETGPGQFNCGFLGTIIDITWPVGFDLLGPDDHPYGYKGVSDHPTLGTLDLTVGLSRSALERALITQVSLPPPTPYDPMPPPHQRIWVALHERGYRELSDGSFEVLKRKSRWKDPQRFADNRTLGRRPLPDEVVERTERRAISRRGSGFEMPPEGYGIFGARPALPAVIRCPDCGTPNRVGALAFDEQRGTWYSVDTG